MKKFYTSKLKDIKDIKERNNIFNNVLSDEDKRKEIAWDALNLLLSETTIPNEYGYWDEDLYDKTSDLSSEELQATLISLQPKENCAVCARGAITLSQIRLGNEISSEGFTNDLFFNIDFMSKIASGEAINIKGFNINDYENMEYAYEGYACTDFVYDNNTKENLANIFCNIIVNGNFNIGDETDYCKKFNVYPEKELKETRL